MSVLQAIILGLTQGLTEFIPVSSSGHLVLMHKALGVTENGLTFDVALHVGTLLALLIFFHKDVLELLKGLVGKNGQQRLALLVVLATIPAVAVGVLLQTAAESTFRSVPLVSINLIIVAVVMLIAERYAAKRKKHTSLPQTSTKQAITVGFAQAVAIIPGISRSGATITAGLFSGMERVAATRFSFLMAMPITAGAILKVLADGSAINQIQSEGALFVVGIFTSLISGLFAIKFLLGYLAKHTLAIFAYYRLTVGAIAILLVTII
jgi:undecaprenyl-diphosphatase